MNTIVLIALLLAEATDQKGRVATIDFFGAGATDTAAIRKSLPVHIGDRMPVTGQEFYAMQGKLREATGASDVALVCCDASGGWNIFISLVKTPEPAARPAPQSPGHLSKEAIEAYERFMRVLPEALARGGASEDRSLGYALSKDAELRATQLHMREIAVPNAQVLIETLDSAKEGQQRIAAAHILGYAEKSPAQVAALVRALEDGDHTVRNNATRALACLVESDASIARSIPVSQIIARARSPIWSDRNKVLMLLKIMTTSRDPQLLSAIRDGALEPLREMARWNSKGHAYTILVVLGRIAGIPESQLVEPDRDAILTRLNER